MNIDWIRRHCLSLPGATEQLQWGDDLVFTVAGKMFAVLPLEPSRVWLSFKASPDEFRELVELRGVIPAPYLARAQWVAVEAEDALEAAEVKRLLAKSHALVVARLPRKLQQELQSRPAAKRPSPRRKRR